MNARTMTAWSWLWTLLAVALIVADVADWVKVSSVSVFAVLILAGVYSVGSAILRQIESRS